MVNEYGFEAGNLARTNPNKTLTYGYDSNWKDKLSSIDFEGTTDYTIEYDFDAIGNLIETYDQRGSAYNITLDWEGRNLIEFEQGLDTFSYTYNQNGIRDSIQKLLMELQHHII